MIVKSIIGLILAIAVGALGISALGDGIFDFLGKSKGGKMVEDARELARVHAIYKIDQHDTLNAFQVEDAEQTVLAGAPTVATYDQVAAELGDLLKGQLQASLGEFSYDVNGEEHFLVNLGTATDFISDEICAEINEMAGEAEGTVKNYSSVGGDLMAVAGADAREFACLTDSDSAENNVFVYGLITD